MTYNKKDYYGFTFYAKNFLNSLKVLSMSLAARGAYIMLLAQQSLSNNCELPNSDRILARLCACDGIDEWLSIKDEVLQCFTVSGDVIYNERLKEERRRIDQLILKKSEAGRKSGEARRKQTANTCSTDAQTDVEQATEQNADTNNTDSEPTRNQKPRASNQEPLTTKKEVSAAVAPISPEVEEEKQQQNCKERKSVFESDTPSNNMSRLLLSYCLFKDTPEKRANLNVKEAQAVRAYVKELISDGYTYESLAEFFAWHKTKFYGQNRKNDDICGYSIVRKNWDAFQNALDAGFKPAACHGSVITTADGERFVYIRDTKSGECFIGESETETVYINKITRQIQTRQSKTGGAQ